MELMTLIQAAEVIGCRPRTLSKAAHEGKLAAQKLGRDWFVTPQALEEWRSKHWMVGTSVPRKRKASTQTT